MDSTLKELRDYAETALEIKQAGRGLEEIQAACTAGSLLLLKCRENSRTLALDADRIREETATQRALLDHASVQLHNLVFEQQYYDKEIASCRTFQSGVSEEKLNCISKEEFLAQAEQAAALAGKSPHEVELARLNYELQQRKQLKARLQQLQQQKQRALAELNAASGKIDDLRTQMETLQHSSKPLMETSLPAVSAIKENKDAAELLPLPLYILYTQAVAGSTMVGLPLKVEIEGSTAAAATLAAAAAAQQDNNAAAAVAGSAAAAAAEPAQASKRRRKSGTHDDQTYKVHPLSVTIDIQSSSQGNAEPVMQLSFQYYTQLKLVGVAASTADDDDILTDLFLGDIGDGQLLENVAAACGSGDYQFGMPGRPRPFRWAQDLAGVDFVSSLPSSLIVADKDARDQLLAKYSAFRSQLRLEAFLDRLTSAKQGRSALNAILAQLSEKRLPPSSWDSNVLMKPNSSVAQWKLIGEAGNAATLAQPANTQQVAAQDVQMWQQQQQMQGSTAEEGEVAGTAADGVEATSRLAHHDTTEEDLLQGLLTDDAAGAGAAGLEGSAVRAVAAAAAATAAFGADPSMAADDALMLDEGALLDGYELAYELEADKEPSEQGEVSGASDDNAADAEAKDTGEVASSSAVQALQVRYSTYKLVLRHNSKALEVYFSVKVFLNYPLYPPMFSVTKVLVTPESEKKARRLVAVNEVLRLEQQANFVSVQAARANPAETLVVQVTQLCQVLDLLYSQFIAKDRVDKLKARQQLRGRDRQARIVVV